MSRSSPRRRRGLLIESIPIGLMAKKLLLLRQRYPDVQWDVLTTESSATEVAGAPLVSKVWTFTDGHVSLRRIGRARLTELHDGSANLVVAPYGDDIGVGFADIREGCRRHRRPAARRTDLGDRERPLPSNTFRWHVKPGDAASVIDALRSMPYCPCCQRESREFAPFGAAQPAIWSQRQLKNATSYCGASPKPSARRASACCT